MRLIYDDDLKRLVDEEWFDCREKSSFFHEIDRTPTIDAVPVVRCKDCKWWGLSSHNTFDIHICKRHNGVRFESDYCSRAERSKNDPKG